MSDNEEGTNIPQDDEVYFEGHLCDPRIDITTNPHTLKHRDAILNSFGKKGIISRVSPYSYNQIRQIMQSLAFHS